MATCIVCNNTIGHGRPKIHLDTLMDGYTIRDRLAQILETTLIRDGYLCSFCQFDLTQIEMYYSLLRVFKQRYLESDQIWRQESKTKVTLSLGDNLFLDNIQSTCFAKDRENSSEGVQTNHDIPTDDNAGGVVQVKTEVEPEVLAENGRATTEFEKDWNNKSDNEMNDSLSGDVSGSDNWQEHNSEDKVSIPKGTETQEGMPSGDFKSNQFSKEEKKKDRNSVELENTQFSTDESLFVSDLVINSECEEEASHLKCPRCYKLCRNETILTNHIKSSHRKARLPCDICDMTFIKVSALQNHKKRNHRQKKNTKILTCTICNMEMSMLKDMKHHMKEHLENSPHGCDICNKKFMEKDKLEEHLRKHRGELPYQCYICGKGFNKPSKRDRHLTVHSDDKPFVCEICGTRIKNKEHYQSHVKAHSENHMCSVCNKKFLTKETLKMHLLIHSDERPYACDKCDKSFRQKGHLQMHKLNVHDRDQKGPPKFVCSTCGKPFYERTQLRYHMMSHTGDWACFCKVCGKGCGNVYILKRHMMVHTGEKGATCPICGKGFLHGGCVTAHMLTHTGEKPYQCPACPKAYTCKSKMKRHVKKHHPGVVV